MENTPLPLPFLRLRLACLCAHTYPELPPHVPRPPPRLICRSHHLQKYPDRAAVDTLNTGCVESQLGLYLQLATLLACDRLLGVASLPAGIWFFTIAG